MTAASAHDACRSCGAALSVTFVDLGSMPVANSFPALDSAPQDEARFPLRAVTCEQCLLVQLDTVVSATDIFSDYAYLSSYSSSWVEHARHFSVEATERLSLSSDSLVVELASNDGYLLRHFVAAGIPVLGVEPAANVAAIAVDHGVPTDVSFFGIETADRLRATGVRADLVVANNVIAHVPDVNDFVAGIATILKPSGVVSLEHPHLLRLIDGVQFDTIYHEHYSYFSLHTIEQVLARHGLEVFDVERLPTHGGSVRVFARHAGTGSEVAASVADLRRDERAAGLHDLAGHEPFAARVAEARDAFRGLIRDERAAGAVIVGYGAAAKASTLLNACGIGATDIEFVVDRNPLKQDRLMPGSRIPIRTPDALTEARPDLIVVFPWNIADEIIGQLTPVRDWGARFVLPIPRARIVP